MSDKDEYIVSINLRQEDIEEIIAKSIVDSVLRTVPFSTKRDISARAKYKAEQMLTEHYVEEMKKDVEIA